MPRTKEKPKSSSATKNNLAAGPFAADTEVLTLAEAASYLRVSEEQVLRLGGSPSFQAFSKRSQNCFNSCHCEFGKASMFWLFCSGIGGIQENHDHRRRASSRSHAS